MCDKPNLQDIRDKFTGDLATWHDYILDQIAHVTEHGLPDAYNEDTFCFLCDLFGGDMPWNPEELGIVEKCIEQSPRYGSLRAAFRKRFGIEFFEEEALEA